MFYLAHAPVFVEEVWPLQDGVYKCPFSGNVFRAGDVVCPAFPSIPMGWSWSVHLATVYAEDLLAAAGCGGTSLNVSLDAFLKSDSLFRGAYIDNLFAIGEVKVK